MILLIDNYDSFVHNLARYVGQLGLPRRVARNDALTLTEISEEPPAAIILSPGPCTPAESGICLPLIEKFHRAIPIFGICLGHQCIGEAFGGRTIRAPAPQHGKASAITHDGSDIFHGLPQPFEAGRYHSLMVDLPPESPLKISARLYDPQGQDVIMALRHPLYPLRSLQFHPESILTPQGLTLMENFFALTARWNEQRSAA